MDKKETNMLIPESSVKGSPFFSKTMFLIPLVKTSGIKCQIDDTTKSLNTVICFKSIN